MAAATTRISERGQVVIPKQIRDRLGLHRGQVLEVDVAGGAIRMRPRKEGKQPASGDWRRWRGVLAGTGALQDLEAEHRREIRRGR